MRKCIVFSDAGCAYIDASDVVGSVSSAAAVVTVVAAARFIPRT